MQLWQGSGFESLMAARLAWRWEISTEGSIPSCIAKLYSPKVELSGVLSRAKVGRELIPGCHLEPLEIQPAQFNLLASSS